MATGRIRTRIIRIRPYRDFMPIARFPTLVIDCPDPVALATFYGALLDWPVEPLEAGGAQIRAEYGDSIGFHQVDRYAPPNWPDQDTPQQMHLDVVVDDLDTAEAAVIGLGATCHRHQPGTAFRVFLDPAGHPFCLCLG
jgi:predicted enzyme related to lactoylglutathione lyase